MLTVFISTVLVVLSIVTITEVNLIKGGCLKCDDTNKTITQLEYMALGTLGVSLLLSIFSDPTFMPIFTVPQDLRSTHTGFLITSGLIAIVSLIMTATIQSESEPSVNSSRVIEDGEIALQETQIEWLNQLVGNEDSMVLDPNIVEYYKERLEAMVEELRVMKILQEVERKLYEEPIDREHIKELLRQIRYDV